MLTNDFVFVDCKLLPDPIQLNEYLENRVYFFFGESLHLPNLMLGYGNQVFYSYRGQENIKQNLEEVISLFKDEPSRPFMIQAISIDLHGIEAGQWLHDCIADHFEHAKNVAPNSFESTAINRVMEELFDEGPLNPPDIKAWLFWLQWSGLLLPALHSEGCEEGDLALSVFTQHTLNKSQQHH
jgi:hypothetical protein